MATIGTTITFSATFVNSSGSAADPDTVEFFLRESIDGTELEWTYNAAPTEGTDYPDDANPVVRDSAGVYHVAWVARKAERHIGHFKASGTVPDQSAETTYLVRHTEVEAAVE